MAETRRARDDAAALADLHRLAARRRTRSPTRCAAAAARRRSRIRSCAGRTCCWRCAFFQLSRRAPELREAAAAQGRRARSCPPATTSTRTSRPRYNPWDQRAVPGARRRPVRGDRERHARRSSPTSIETFTESGHAARVRRRARGRHHRHRDRAEPAGCSAASSSPSTAATVDLSETVGYKGMMLSGVPNFALALGYTNASWTLKCDLVARVRLPAAQPHGRARLRAVHAARAATRRADASRSSTSPPATCCARSTSCPKQGARDAVAAVPELRARHRCMLRRGAARGRGRSSSRACPPPSRRCPSSLRHHRPTLFFFLFLATSASPSVDS